MEVIQLLQITPDELAERIKEGLKPELKALIREQTQSEKQSSEFLTREETCDFFQISKVTLHDWVKKDILTPYKMGNRTYFCRAELVEKLRNSNSRGKS